MTDGVLLRESLTTPDLDQYSAIIMDEARTCTCAHVHIGTYHMHACIHSAIIMDEARACASPAICMHVHHQPCAPRVCTHMRPYARARGAGALHSHYIYVLQAHERSLNTDVLFGILKKVWARACMFAHLCMSHRATLVSHRALPRPFATAFSRLVSPRWWRGGVT